MFACNTKDLFHVIGVRADVTAESIAKLLGSYIKDQLLDFEDVRFRRGFRRRGRDDLPYRHFTPIQLFERDFRRFAWCSFPQTRADERVVLRSIASPTRYQHLPGS